MNIPRKLMLLVGILAAACLVPVAGEVARTRKPLPVLPKPAPSTEYTVAGVVDGDTIVVQDAGRGLTVRLIGVDTPETVHPDKPPQPYGKEASAFLSNLLKGENVHLVEDPNADKIDRYGHHLAYVYRAPDGLFVNAETIRQGYGRAYLQFPFSYSRQVKDLEDFAQSAGKGLWPVKVEADALAVAPTRPSAAGFGFRFR